MSTPNSASLARRLRRQAGTATLLAALAPAHGAEPMVSVGLQHSLALQADGTVLAWGADHSGQLGRGRASFQTRPAPVTTLDGVRVAAIASGAYHGLAVGAEGRLWTWGENADGQLGDGGTAGRSLPALVAGLSGVAAACGGDAYTLALDGAGRVWSWGSAEHGVLGRDTPDGAARTPGQVAGLEGVRALACGAQHALALRQDGTLWAWGANADGQLGDGGTTDRTRPVALAGLPAMRAVAAGPGFSVALAEDGTVWEWGVVDPYAAPHGAPRTRPARTAGLAGVAAIAADPGRYAVLALGATGGAWWRWQTGTAPEAQPALAPLLAATAGYGATFLLDSAGSVWGYGFNGNGFGTLGDGTVDYREVPAPVVDLSNAVQVAAGAWHGLALDRAGRVWSWGLDASGQLGRGRELGVALPAPVAGLGATTQVSAGDNHSLALDGGGRVWAWGSNGYGQLGNGGYGDSAVPLALTALADVQAVAAGSLYSLALTRDGTAWQWGATLPGVITATPALPTAVLDHTAALAAANGHALALRRDGSVWAWGYNDAGQLGQGHRNPVTLPVQVSGLAGIVAVAAAGASSYALDAAGRIWVWGENADGQLGTDLAAVQERPVRLDAPDQATAIAAGSRHALARTADGRVWGWGAGYDGALGPVSDPRPRPAPLALEAPVARIAAGGTGSALLGDGGLLYTAGGNALGQLGNGTFAQGADFSPVVNPGADGLLDLYPDRPDGAPARLLPPFLVRAARLGELSRLSLWVDVRGLLEGAAATRAAARYNLYVAALAGNAGASPVWLQLPADRNWRALAWPMAEFLSGVALANRADTVTLRILEGVDLSALPGARFYVGYGTDPLEMLTAGRAREVFTVPQ